MSQEAKAAIQSFFRTFDAVKREGKLTDQDATLVYRSKMIAGDPTANLLGVVDHVMNKEIEFNVPNSMDRVNATIRLNTKTSDGQAKEVSGTVLLTAADGPIFDKVMDAVSIQGKTKELNYIERKSLDVSEMTLAQKQKITFATIENGPASKFLDMQSHTTKHGFYNFSESGTNAIFMRHAESIFETPDAKYSEMDAEKMLLAMNSELMQYEKEVNGTIGRFHQMLKDDAREAEELNKIHKNQRGNEASMKT